MFQRDFSQELKGMSTQEKQSVWRTRAHDDLNWHRKKSSVKIQHPCLVKDTEESWIRRDFLNTINSIYEKPTASILLCGKD